MTMSVSSRRLSRRWVAFPVLLGLILFTGLRLVRAQAEPSQDGPLQTNTDVARARFIGNDTIIKMAKAGLDDTIIIQTIETQPGRYDTSPDDLIALKNAGVSQRVIAAMQARSAGLAIHAASKINPAPLASGIDEIGVYYQDKTGEWIPLKTERVEFKSSGWLKNAATDGLVKQDMNGHLEGPKSPLILPTGVNILIYAPAGTQAEEYDFLRFEEHSHSRDFRVKTGGLFHSRTGSYRDEVEFTAHKIAPQMYVFTVPADIQKGEYGVLPPGSSNVPGIANAGKIFTFSIRE
ncbi:MAG TPA: hypothetical protein VHY48_04670 [Acidobacteriaceae bacterium]|nr:hypothetical protein [Acidobacteriaceae bacterium]